MAKVLVVGGGGREHALGWKLAKSSQVAKVFYAPGNAGTAAHGENVDIGVKDFAKLKAFCLKEGVEMLVVGPEDPLCGGIHDDFASDASTAHIVVVGPKAAGARLEGSKAFSKDFLNRHNVPTAGHKTFTKETLAAGKEYLSSLEAPYVLKADGLAAGKGVLIEDTLEKAEEDLEAMLSGMFGAASEGVVIEEFMKGVELSVFVLIDSKGHYLILPSSCDFKRAGEGDTGLNTGGMGAVSPAPFAREGSAFMDKVESKVIKPTVAGLVSEDLGYTGFLYIGLMKCNDEPKVVEFNCRMGDPETEVVMPRIKSDLYPLLKALKDGSLDQHKIEYDERHACGVVMVSGGYPGSYAKGVPIEGLAKAAETDDFAVFHAGTKPGPAGSVVTAGGRVLVFSAIAPTLPDARRVAYERIQLVTFDAASYRKDIATKLIEDFP
ncbi:Phosphoribosylamine--glycine ligase [Diplonema papillatum]|nr:Phosphoribosylamine--glycine ligase [Diplonema papillatum]|eukprot:gene6805-10427_t